MTIMDVKSIRKWAVQAHEVARNSSHSERIQQVLGRPKNKVTHPGTEYSKFPFRRCSSVTTPKSLVLNSIGATLFMLGLEDELAYVREDFMEALLSQAFKEDPEGDVMIYRDQTRIIGQNKPTIVRAGIYIGQVDGIHAVVTQGQKDYSVFPVALINGKRTAYTLKAKTPKKLFARIETELKREKWNC